jgi:hypothetical protein
MPKGYFSVSGWSTRSDVDLEVDRISGVGGPAYPRLIIPVEFTLRPAEDKGKIKAYSLLWLQSGLYIENIKIGEGFSGPIAEYSWPHVSPHQISIEIPLDLYRLEKIEERRRDDIQFRLSSDALVAEHPSIPKAGPNEQQEYRRDVEGFTKGHFEITFSIPQSHWVDKILPGLGYGKVKLIEIPIPEKIVPDTIKNAQEELVQAQDYFVQGDYDKAVEHCRNALEPLKELLPEIKTLLRNSKFEWVEEVGQATYDWIDKIYKKTRDVSSIPHHPPSIGHFSRFEAQAILMVTIALLSYSGKLLKQEKKNERGR